MQNKDKQKENPLFGRFDDVVKAVANSRHLKKVAKDVKVEKSPRRSDAPTLRREVSDHSLFQGQKPLKFIDMFCGIGGFHQAAASLGMECVFACDIDEECRNAYEHNYGIRPVGDISRVKPESIPDHDILLAGFPCQPFSIIGNRAGFADVRGTLFFELARIIEVKRPKAVVLENVKQLASHNKGQTLARILEVLKSLGYWTDYRIFNAINFGLPQKRERIVIVALQADVEVFPWPAEKIQMTPLSEILEKNPDPKHFVSERIKWSRHTAHTPKVSPSIWHENKSGNVSSYPYSCALRAGASYNYLLVDGKRRLTPREMLRLQGFPDTFEIVCNDSQTRKQAGNAVPVPMIAAVLNGVLNVETTEAEGKATAPQRSVSSR